MRSNKNVRKLLKKYSHTTFYVRPRKGQSTFPSVPVFPLSSKTRTSQSWLHVTFSCKLLSSEVSSFSPLGTVVYGSSSFALQNILEKQECRDPSVHPAHFSSELDPEPDTDVVCVSFLVARVRPSMRKPQNRPLNRKPASHCAPLTEAHQLQRIHFSPIHKHTGMDQGLS